MNAALSSVSGRQGPPFRADQVGSLLRPAYLLEARTQHEQGRISAPQLRAVEDRAIAEAVEMQQDAGLKAITDGEYRRTYFHLDFLQHLEGVQCDAPVTVRKPDGTEEFVPSAIRVSGRIRHVKDIQRADFEYLASRLAPGHVGKVTIPSPTMLHFRGGRAAISSESYPRLEPDFYQDVADAYGAELRSLAAAGCRYVQLDDTNLAYLCDEHIRETVRARGEDPDELPRRYARFVNMVAAHKPDGMTLAIHLCRGNFRSTWAAQGGYEPVAEALFTQMNVDAYFLEYDSARSGDFAPLRHLPKHKIAVLGLVTTKLGEMESPAQLKRRLDEAAKFAPLEQLALSPQCGFSSTVHGNNISFAQQRAKLELVVRTALEVWGSL